MLAVLLAAFIQNRCCGGLLCLSPSQLLRRCHWCVHSRKGLMPPSCGLLEPHGWLVPAAIFQPHSLLGQGRWWLWALGQMGAERGGPAWPQPSSTALMEVCQADFVGPQWLFSSSLHTVAYELSEFIVRKPPLLLETFFVLSDVFSLHWKGMWLY